MTNKPKALFTTLTRYGKYVTMIDISKNIPLINLILTKHYLEPKSYNYVQRNLKLIESKFNFEGISPVHCIKRYSLYGL